MEDRGIKLASISEKNENKIRWNIRSHMRWSCVEDSKNNTVPH
jgi:hypothetical protein